MNPLHDLLERAAGDEPVGFDHTDVRARLDRHTRRRQRTLLAASIAVLILVAVGTVALAARDGDTGVVADSTTVSREELTDDWWVARAFSKPTAGPAQPAFVEFRPDGHMRVYDGCTVTIARWTLEGPRLKVDDPETYGGCDDPTELLDVLTTGASVGRPLGPPGALELRSPEGFVTFDQFDDLGRIPTDTDVIGAWTDGSLPADGSFTFQIAFERGGVARWAVQGCDATSRWDLDDGLLDIEEPDWPTGCGAFGMSNNLWDEASRVRVADDNIWFANDNGVSLFERVVR